MTRKTHPHQQPTWCEIQHRPDWRIHSAVVGEVEIGDHASVSVEVNDFGDGEGGRVTVTVLSEHPYAAMDATQSRELAGYLYRGAALLEGDVAERRGRRGHAFTVERTRGDAFVWRCRCSFVLVQDSAEVSVQADLIAHATGAGR